MKKILICLIIVLLFVVIATIAVKTRSNNTVDENGNFVENIESTEVEETLDTEEEPVQEEIISNENLKIDTIKAPFYGNIKIGSKVFEMYITEDELKDLGFVEDTLTKGYYKDSDSEDYLNYHYLEYEGSGKREVEIKVYNDVLSNNGYRGYGKICNNLVLPGNITFNSTLDDVKKVYGEPVEIKEIDTLSGNNILKGDTDETAKIATYAYNDGNDNTMGLRLYFLNSNNKLYDVYYVINLPKAVEE